jgi:hypothetical protein
MNVTYRLVWPTVALMVLAGCATAPSTLPDVATAPVAPIAVSCQTDTITDQPCIAMARKRCSAPTVDTIRLVLARQVPAEAQDAPKSVYEYQATYTCPGQPVASVP